MAHHERKSSSPQEFSTKDAVQSYNPDTMRRAFYEFSRANEKNEKLSIAQYLAKFIPSGAAVLDLGGGTGIVASNILESGATPSRYVILEPTQTFISEARNRLLPWGNNLKLQFLPANFKTGMPQLSSGEFDLAFESNASPNFCENCVEMIETICTKLKSNGTFISVLPGSNAQYAEFNRWAYSRLRNLYGWKRKDNDFAKTLRQETTEWTKGPSGSGWQLETDQLDCSFLYPIEKGEVREYVTLFLIFMFELTDWVDPKNPPRQFIPFIEDVEKWLSDRSLIHEDGIRMSLQFQALHLTRKTK